MVNSKVKPNANHCNTCSVTPGLTIMPASPTVRRAENSSAPAASLVARQAVNASAADRQSAPSVASRSVGEAPPDFFLRSSTRTKPAMNRTPAPARSGMKMRDWRVRAAETRVRASEVALARALGEVEVWLRSGKRVGTMASAEEPAVGWHMRFVWLPEQIPKTG